MPLYPCSLQIEVSKFGTEGENNREEAAYAGIR